MKYYNNEQVQAVVRIVEGKFLQARYHLETNPIEITVGKGENWSVLACKEAYGKAVKTAKELEVESCLFDMTGALALGEDGIAAKVDVAEMMGSSVHLHVTAMGRDVVLVISTMNMTGEELRALSTGSVVKFNFAGHVCHVFNKETGINLEA